MNGMECGSIGGAGEGDWTLGEGVGQQGVGGTPNSYIYNTGVNMVNTM